MKSSIHTNRIRMLILALLGLVLRMSPAQVNALRRYTGADGKQTEFVYALCSDREGYFWLGTDKGLFRFNGETFIRFDTSMGLAESFVTVLTCDAQGKIWAGHLGGGISVFENGKPRTLRKGGPEGGKITAVCNEAGGGVTFASEQGLIIRFDKNEKAISMEKGLEGMALQSICPLSSGTWLLGTAEGLKIYDSEKSVLKALGGSLPTLVSSIQPFGNDGYIVAFREEGIYHLRRNENDWQLERMYETDLSVNSVLVHSDKEIMLGTARGGVLRLNPGTQPGQWIASPLSITAPMNVQALMKDPEEQIWVGTSGQGFAQLALEPMVLWEYDQLLYGKDVYASSADPAGPIWLATDRGLLQFARPGDFQPARFLPFVKSKITCLYTDVNSVLWIGTDGAGICRLAPGATTVQPFPIAGMNGLSAIITSLYVSATGELWAGTQEGLFQSGPGSYVKKYSLSDGLPHNQVRQVTGEKNGNIWVMTQGQFLSLVHGGEVSNLPIDGPYPTGIATDPEGGLWIATSGSGLLRFSDKIEKIYDTKSGILSDNVYQVFATPDFVIAAHRGGYSLLDKKTGRTGTIGVRSTLGQAIKLNNQICLSKQGDVVSVTAGGAALINPIWRSGKVYPPSVRIESLEILGENRAPEKGLELPYNNYRIRFFIQGINSSGNGDLKYRYILEGTNLGWSEFSSEKEIYYPYLGPGEYVLRVEARNEAGIVSEKQAEYRFVILQPFWKRSWFIGAILLLLLIMGMAFDRYRTRSLIRSKEILERMVTERTEEIRRNKEEIARINARLEIALRGSQAKNEALVNAIPDLMLMVDRKGVLIDFRANEMNGEKPKIEKMKGKPLGDLIHQDQHHIGEIIGEVFRSDVVRPLEFSIELKGENRIFEARIARSGENEALLLARDITERLKMEEERSEQQKRLSKAILETQENERKRFAEDLHDGLGQLLSATKMNLNTLEARLKDSDSEVQNGIGNLKKLLNESIQEARGISHSLMPGMLKDFGLNAALEDLAEKVNQAGGTQIKLSVYGEVPRIEKQLEIALYRVVQEVVNNALKHSQASTISVQLNFSEDSIFLDIEDDGVGFDVDAKRIEKKGIGLFSLENRVKAFDGVVEIDSRPGKGTLVTVEVPMKDRYVS